MDKMLNLSNLKIRRGINKQTQNEMRELHQNKTKIRRVKTTKYYKYNEIKKKTSSRQSQAQNKNKSSEKKRRKTKKNSRETIDALP